MEKPPVQAYWLKRLPILVIELDSLVPLGPVSLERFNDKV